MNIPKKQKRIPKWLPTTAILLAILAVILFIYIIVTFIDGSGRPSADPTPVPSPTVTPAPTEDPVMVLAEQPLTTENSISTYYGQIKAYLTETLGEEFSADTLTVYKKSTPVTGTSLIYARYMKGNVYAVSELLLADTVSEAASDGSLSDFLLYSRQQTDVSAVYIQALVNNFYYYRNHEDADGLASLLSNASPESAADIISRMEYIDSITVTGLLTHPITSDTVSFMLIVSEDIKLLGIDTPAPGLSEVLIHLDKDYYPSIFIGETDAACDLQREEFKSTMSFKTIKETTEAELSIALESDEKLKAAYENLTSD